MSERVNFDLNQRFLVAPDKPEVDNIPCLTHLEHKLREIPRKSWITYKGLANFLGKTYLRFHYEGEDLLLPFDILNYLEEVPHHMPGIKTKYVKKGLNAKNQVSKTKKYIGYGTLVKTKRTRKKRKIR